jgi:formylmethanofuran dehydrogenase subunit E
MAKKQYLIDGTVSYPAVATVEAESFEEAQKLARQGKGKVEITAQLADAFEPDETQEDEDETNESSEVVSCKLCRKEFLRIKVHSYDGGYCCIDCWDDRP